MAQRQPLNQGHSRLSLGATFKSLDFPHLVGATHLMPCTAPPSMFLPQTPKQVIPQPHPAVAWIRALLSVLGLLVERPLIQCPYLTKNGFCIRTVYCTHSIAQVGVEYPYLEWELRSLIFCDVPSHLLSSSSPPQTRPHQPLQHHHPSLSP